jgi:hypothetical protein
VDVEEFFIIDYVSEKLLLLITGVGRCFQCDLNRRFEMLWCSEGCDECSECSVSLCVYHSCSSE